MQFLDVLATLSDLPSTFTRTSGWVPQLMDATANQIGLETAGCDGIMVQTGQFPATMNPVTRQVTYTGNGAIDGWLDIWGAVANLPRYQGEGNQPYAVRIIQTVLAWIATPPGVNAWLNLYAPGGTNTENIGTVGYVLNLPSNMTASQVVRFLSSFNRIRPNGVPFTVLQGGGSLFAGTTEFLGTENVPGSYLGNNGNLVAGVIGASTLSAISTLPTLMFTDPVLNPGIAAQQGA